MKTKISTTILMTVFLLAATGASAQDEFWGSISATATCAGSDVQLAVTFNNATDPAPADWVGWVIERKVAGACVGDVQITDVMALPTENGTFDFVDTLDLPSVSAIYYVKAVDTNGDRHWIYWPQRGWFVHAVCPNVPAVRGVVNVENGDFPWIRECPDQCWLPMSMTDAVYPPDLVAMEGAIIDVYGELRLGLEGYYVIVTGWAVSEDECGPVPVDPQSWSDVKGRFR